MKMQIFTHDVPNLIGKFIIQITEVNEELKPMVLNEDNWGFYKEKRIYFVCESDTGIELQGFYYKHSSFKTREEFVEYFNNYRNDSNDRRFHRLLTVKEIDFVCKKMKENQYN